MKESHKSLTAREFALDVQSYARDIEVLWQTYFDSQYPDRILDKIRTTQAQLAGAAERLAELVLEG